MSPEVSQAVGRVIQTMSLVAGPVLSRLHSVAETATNVADLPLWVQQAWKAIQDGEE